MPKVEISTKCLQLTKTNIIEGRNAKSKGFATQLITCQFLEESRMP
jgi:hypothetical protein